MRATQEGQTEFPQSWRIASGRGDQPRLRRGAKSSSNSLWQRASGFGTAALSVLVLGLTLAAPVQAQTFRAENRVTVTPVANGFAIADGNGQWARGMWCAAADYAQDVLGAGGTQRIYVAQGKGRGAGNPVVFTLDPAGLTPSSITVLTNSIRTPGANLSVDQAQIYCADHKLRNSR